MDSKNNNIISSLNEEVSRIRSFTPNSVITDKLIYKDLSSTNRIDKSLLDPIDSRNQTKYNTSNFYRPTAQSKKAKVFLTSMKKPKMTSNNLNVERRKSFKLNFQNIKLTKNSNQVEKVEVNYAELDRIKEKLSFGDKVKGWFMCKSQMNDDLRLKLDFYKRSCKRIENKMDIYHILTKFDEFDNFKMMFLNPFQVLSMRYMKKPNISNVNVSNVVDFYECFTNDKNDVANVQKIIDYFEEKIKTDSLDIMDKKILELLDPEIKKTILLNA